MTARDDATTRQDGAREGEATRGAYDSQIWPFQECNECGKEFDLFNERDAEEWNYGHDCEATG